MPLDDEHVKSLAKMLETMADECEENGTKVNFNYDTLAQAKLWLSLCHRLRLASKGLKFHERKR
jgi:hypothetical protein